MNIMMVCGLLMAMALLAMAVPAVKDAMLKTTKALPGGASSVYSTGIDTQVTTAGQQPSEVEWLLTAPALAVGELANGSTMTYSIVTDTVAPIDASSTVLMPSVIVQTGAGGVGAAAATYRFKLPSNAGRILGVKATNSAAADASGKSLTLEAVF